MRIRKIITLSSTFLILILTTFLCISCKDGNKKNNNVKEIVTQIMSESEPNTNVVIGDFDSMITGNYNDFTDDDKNYSASSVFDAPRNYSINVVVNEDEERPLNSIPSLLSNIASANDELQTITIKDRNGKSPYVSLSAGSGSLSVSKLGGFEYGEVYQIYINDAPYLAFEEKDPQIRMLTIEIEDDPSEDDTYDIKEKKDGIINLDRNNISNKKMDSDEILSFDYFDASGTLNLKKDDIFYATILNKPDAQLDFYGIVDEASKKGNTLHVKYKAPSISDIYNNFRMKGISPFNLDNSKVLLTEKIALEEFRTSTLATALGMTMINELNFTPDDVMNVMKKVNLSVNINFVGNTLDFKIVLKLGNFKIKDGIYFSFEFGYEKYTEYNIDFDVSVRTEWIIPCGVDYKVKMVEDSQTVYYFKISFDKNMIDEIPNDTDYTEKLLDEFDKCVNEDTDTFGYLKDEDVTPSTSGTRTTLPLLEVNSFYFSPLQIKFKIDFYLDLGIQAKGLFKVESHSRKIDFNFTNVDGAGQSDSTEVAGTSNLVIVAGGSAHAEVGLRVSLGISILGLYDYLHAEAYAEAFLNVTYNGLLGIDWNLTGHEFSGFICADLNVIAGVRAGLNFKVLIFDYNLSKTWASSLFRLKYDNALEHWSEDAETTIELNKKQTIDIDDTQCLRLKYFDGIAFSLKEKKYKSDDTISIMSGALCPNSLIEATTANIFKFTVADSNLISIDKDGVLRVADGTANEFTTTFTVGVNNLAGYVGDRTITVHFVAGDTKEVYAGDDLIGEYRPGASFTLPEAKVLRGKEFDHYRYNGVDYKPGDSFVMPSTASERVVLELHYNELPKYKVYFYDGYNILVAIDEVYKYESATAPYDALRDCHMDEGWVFVSWDQSFDNVLHEMHVNAIYIKIE